MPSSGSRKAVILLKHIGEILIFLMVILNGYSVNVLVFFRISIELSWMLGLKKKVPCWLCHPLFFLPWLSPGLPSRIILKILQKEVLFLSWIPGTEISSSFDSKFPSFLKLDGHITAKFPAILLYLLLYLICTNLSITREPLPPFSEWVDLSRVVKSEIRSRSMTNFEPDGTQNGSTAANSFVKGLWWAVSLKDIHFSFQMALLASKPLQITWASRNVRPSQELSQILDIISEC